MTTGPIFFEQPEEDKTPAEELAQQIEIIEGFRQELLKEQKWLDLHVQMINSLSLGRTAEITLNLSHKYTALFKDEPSRHKVKLDLTKKIKELYEGKYDIELEYLSHEMPAIRLSVRFLPTLVQKAPLPLDGDEV